jgi:hypothetical protein
MKKSILLTLLLSSYVQANTVTVNCSKYSGDITMTVPDQSGQANTKLRPEIHYKMRLSDRYSSMSDVVAVTFSLCINNQCNVSTENRFIPLNGVTEQFDTNLNTGISLPTGNYPLSYQITVPSHGCDLISNATMSVK